MSNNALRTRTSKSRVKVDAVKASQYQKPGSLTAHMRQDITTHSWYQAKETENSMTHNLFGASDFGADYKEKEYDSVSSRVAFILVPPSETVETITKRIEDTISRNNAVKAAMEKEGVKVPRELSVETALELDKAWGHLMHSSASVRDLENYQLTDPCCYRVLSNHPILTSSQEYAISIGQTTKDVIANSQATRYPKGDALEGQLVTDNNGKVQYRSVFFSSFHIDDKDWRTNDLDDVYHTPEIREELGIGQTVINDEQLMSASDSQGQSV